MGTYTQRVCKPIEERFWAKVSKDGPPTETLGQCWPFDGGPRSKGYGNLARGRRGEGKVLAHRFAYELLVGPIPAGMQLDHLCRNPHCVNPAHLEPVTHRVNLLRGVGQSAINAAKTHCKHDHPLSGGNLRVWTKPNGKSVRICIACLRVNEAKTRARRRSGITSV